MDDGVSDEDADDFVMRNIVGAIHNIALMDDEYV